MELDREGLLKLYTTMTTIRHFEERGIPETGQRGMSASVHSSAGQEAVPTGVCANLSDEDYIGSTHRGHGHCIAKGVDVHGMMAELFGRTTGLCGGKGGSMHVADLKLGMMGANGIVGAGPPLVTGAALAAKRAGKGNVAVAFVGDGGSNQGTTFESLNLAKVWNLPAVFVVEDNGYAEATSSKWSIGAESNAVRARGFGLPAVRVDGHDFFAVHEAAGEAIQRARDGGGPSLLDCKLNRYYGHFEGDAQTYRGSDEVKNLRADQDCLVRFSKFVTESGDVAESELVAIDQEVLELIEGAVADAKSAPKPAAEDLLTDVYVSY